MQLIEEELEEFIRVILLGALEQLILLANRFLQGVRRKDGLLPRVGAALGLVPHLVEEL